MNQERYFDLDRQIRKLYPYITACFKKSIQSINSVIGSRYQCYADIKQKAYRSPDEFRSAFFNGWTDEMEYRLVNDTGGRYKNSASYQLFCKYIHDRFVKEYLELFLKRSFYKYHKEYTREKPELNLILWFGSNDSFWGIGVSPRFKNGKWENDKSEVRKAAFEYWTLGHVMETGLLYPHADKKRRFCTIEEYLNFFNSIVALTNSSYEKQVAKRYSEYVIEKNSPETPLLIPQLRYGGVEQKHRYRLDFLVITKDQHGYGFELSPYSTHFTKEQYERDHEKRKAFEEKYNLHYVVYTDKNIMDPDGLFAEIKEHLEAAVEDEETFVCVDEKVRLLVDKYHI